MCKADEQIGVRPYDLTDDLTIFAIPFGLYVNNDTNALVIVSSWRRINEDVILVGGKIRGAYVNSAYAKISAVRSSVTETRVLTQDGHITPNLRRSGT